MEAPKIGTVRHVHAEKIDILYPGEQAIVTNWRQDVSHVGTSYTPCSYLVRPAPGFRAWWLRTWYRLTH